MHQGQLTTTNASSRVNTQHNHTPTTIRHHHKPHPTTHPHQPPTTNTNTETYRLNSVRTARVEEAFQKVSAEPLLTVVRGDCADQFWNSGGNKSITWVRGRQIADPCGADGGVVNKTDKPYLVGRPPIDVMCDSWICAAFFDVERPGYPACRVSQDVDHER